MQTLARPFGWLLLKLYELTGSYGVALILFALLIRLILLPFTIKSKMSLLRTSRLQPQVAELERRHGANSRKYTEEVRKLYKEEGASMTSGCLWTFIQLPVLLLLYQAIRYPITVMMGVGKDLLAEGGAIFTKLTELGYSSNISSAYSQISQAQFISEHFDAFKGISDKLVNIDFNFLGLNIGQMPDFRFWTFFKEPELWPVLGLFAIPFLAAFLTMVQSKVSEKTNGAQSQQQQSANASMTATMPIITLFFCFGMPAAMGIYWAAGSAIQIVQDLALSKIYRKQYERENAEAIEREKRRQAEWEAKKAETERLREQNATTVNKNTSKKKKQQQERLEREAKQAEWENEKNGKDKNPSRVGDRPNARGRAYDPDRYKKKD